MSSTASALPQLPVAAASPLLEVLVSIDRLAANVADDGFALAIGASAEGRMAVDWLKNTTLRLYSLIYFSVVAKCKLLVRHCEKQANH